MFNSDSKMSFAPMRLQEACMKVIIKHELSRDRLPEVIIEEVDKFERKILSAFNGRFYTNRRQLTTGIVLTVHLDCGSLELTFGKVKGERRLWEWKKESLLIKAGEKNKVGKLGTKQFMLPGGKEVFMYDFRIDIEKMEINLLGSCSSIPLKINLCFDPDDDESASLRIETMLYSEREKGLHHVLVKRIFAFRRRRLRNVIQTLAVNQSSESESDADSESTIEI